MASYANFHDTIEASKGKGEDWFYYHTESKYRFENFFHPFVGELISQLNKESLPGMLDPVFLEKLSKQSESPGFGYLFHLFRDFYQQPATHDLVNVEGSPKKIDTAKRRAVRQLQLGAVLPYPADHRRAPEQEPALRRGPALVPLHLRPDLQRPITCRPARALLEVPRLPQARARTA